jgi:hypothetical protein
MLKISLDKFKQENIIGQKEGYCMKLKRILSYLLLVVFAAAFIYILLYKVPKYGEYYSSTDKARVATGYYNLENTMYPARVGNKAVVVDLQIDYPQWLILMGAECLLFLTPAIVLYNSSKKRIEKSKAPD